MGRTDVDGLKGGEVNSYQAYVPVVPARGDTLRARSAARLRIGPPRHQRRPDGRLRRRATPRQYGVRSPAGSWATTRRPPCPSTTRSHATSRSATAGSAAIPGPTFRNRFYELTGRPNLDARGSGSSTTPARSAPSSLRRSSTTCGRRSARRSVTWRYFEHGYCSLRFFERYTFDDDEHLRVRRPGVRLLSRCARSGQLPSVSFIDPHFVDYPPGSNCDEPPAISPTARRSCSGSSRRWSPSPAWNKTMLLIVYDEHGGFYDHVPPPRGAAGLGGLPITTLGLRVPAFVISPWVSRGQRVRARRPGRSTRPAAGKDSRDSRGPGLFRPHLDPEDDRAAVPERQSAVYGRRYAAANDLSAVMANNLREPQFLPFVRYR